MSQKEINELKSQVEQCEANLRAAQKRLFEARVKYHPLKVDDILEKLKDLHKQATTEKSHYYVASCCNEAIEEIERLRYIE